MASSIPEDVCRFLEWDSRFFRLNIGRANGSRLSKERMPILLDWCGSQRIDCLYLLADPEHAETAELAAENGFELVDIRLTFEHNSFGLAGGGPQSLPAAVRRFESSDLPALREMAG